MKKWLILIILLLPLVAAQDNYNAYDELEVNVVIENEITVISDNPDLDYLETELFFLPKDNSYQDVSYDVEIFPDGVIDDDEDLKIRWTTDSSAYNYHYTATVNRRADFIEIRNKINFPIVETDDSVRDYVQESEYIDINEDIQDKALEIVQSEDDLYEAVFKLAQWTEDNIEYDLNTVTSSAVQKSSWVLENEEGVCDELTNLFLSFCRSLGIPAKFVSGMAYTNLLGDFGAHGWAEVYIDGEWIPIDVTYGQFGWVDPSHIKFQEAIDSGEGSASFRWQGSNLDFDIGELEIDVEMVEAIGENEDYLEMEIYSLVDNVGAGSYVPIQVELTNNNDFYVPGKVSMTKAPEVIGDNVENALLLPHEEKSVFFIVKVEDSPESNSIYTTTIEAASMFGEIVSSEFSYSNGEEVITEEEAQEMIDLLSSEEESLIDIEVDCSMNKASFYDYEEGSLSCEVEGVVDELCFLEDCKEEDFTWNLVIGDYNSQRYAVIANKDGKVKYEYFNLIIFKDPNLQIEIDPTSFDFKDEVEFTITLTSDSELENLTMIIEKYGTVRIEQLKREYSFVLPIEGREFSGGDIGYVMTYEDSLGTLYDKEGKFNISVENVPFFYRLYYSFINIFS
jgi:transglutaminase-like putative cysteine protease